MRRKYESRELRNLRRKVSFLRECLALKSSEALRWEFQYRRLVQELRGIPQAPSPLWMLPISLREP